MTLNQASSIEYLQEADTDIELGLLGLSSLHLLPDDPLANLIAERALSIPSVRSSILTARRVLLRTLGRIWALFTNSLNELKPFFFIMLYSVLGAGLFMWIEIPNNISGKSEALQYHLMARNSLLTRLKNIYEHDGEDREKRWKEAILNYENVLGVQEPDLDTDWTFWISFLYAGTIITTIGYGHIACKTMLGQLVTMIYAIFGIPLMLIVLNDLSKVLLKFVHWISDFIGDIILFIGVQLRICKPNPRRTSRFNFSRRTRTVTLGVLGATIDSNETTSPELITSDEAAAEEDPPVIGAVIFTVGWLFLCAAVFCIWEDWTYWTSFYFFFISLTTIGFGDVLPAYPEYMFMTFGVVMIGLALVSVCINVVQEKLNQLYMKLLDKLLAEYQKAIEQGDETAAVKGMMVGFQGQAKFLMPLMSKTQGERVMTQFKEKAKAQGIELPAVLTNLDPETGLPAFAKAKADDFQQYIEKAAEEAKPPDFKSIEIQTAAAAAEFAVKSTQYEIHSSTVQLQTADLILTANAELQAMICAETVESSTQVEHAIFVEMATQVNGADTAESETQVELVCVEADIQVSIRPITVDSETEMLIDYAESTTQIEFDSKETATRSAVVHNDMESQVDATTTSTFTEIAAQTESPETVEMGIQPELSTIFIPEEEEGEESQSTEEGGEQQTEQLAFLRHRSTQTEEETKEVKKIRRDRLRGDDVRIAFSYWDGSDHRHDLVMNKGNTIGQFLAQAIDLLRKEFAEMKNTTAENLIFVKEDIIIPHFYTFQDIITMKAMGKTGPLYEFDAPPEDSESSPETTGSHPAKILLRSWYDKNHQTPPASQWEPFVPNKKYK